MHKYLLYLVLAISLVACGTNPDLETATRYPELRPYLTATPSPTGTPIPPASFVSLPTPTPIIHIVEGNDTLIGIADQYGITLEDLQAANPDVSPLYLQVGTELVIPLGSNIPVEPTVTPVPILIRQLNCYPTADGGMWCLALVTNDSPDTVENLSALMTLYDKNGEEITSQLAFAPLNILPTGESMPIAAIFPAPLPADVVPEAQLLTAIRILPTDTRYIPAVIQNILVSIDWNSKIARISGQVTLTQPESWATQIWLLAVAYDSGGNVVGFRRWEHYDLLTAGERREFSFSVSSLGPDIASVELLIECRP
jgi:LysM repeat protein